MAEQKRPFLSSQGTEVNKNFTSYTSNVSLKKKKNAVSDLGLHCLPITLLQVSPLQWVNGALVMLSNLDSPLYILEESNFNFRYVQL